MVLPRKLPLLTNAVECCTACRPSLVPGSVLVAHRRVSTILHKASVSQLSRNTFMSSYALNQSLYHHNALNQSLYHHNALCMPTHRRHGMQRSFATATLPLWSIKPTRTSSSFTFSTRYPRQNKPVDKSKSSSKSSSKSKSSRGQQHRGSSSGMPRNVRLPARLRLDRLKSVFPDSQSQSSSQPKQSSRPKRSPSVPSHFGGKYDTNSDGSDRVRSKPRAPSRPSDKSDSMANSRPARYSNQRRSSDKYDEYGNLVVSPTNNGPLGAAGRIGWRSKNAQPEIRQGHASTRSRSSPTAAAGVGRGSPTSRLPATSHRSAPRTTGRSTKPTSPRAREVTALFRSSIGLGANAVMKKRQEKREVLERRAAHSKKFALLDNLGQGKSNKEIQDIIDSADFASMGLHPKILDALMIGMKFETPTPVQAMCIPRFIHRTDEALLCAAETGSGKTAAYLASIMHFLKTEEDKAMATSPSHSSSTQGSTAAQENISGTVYRAVEAITAEGDSISSVSGLASIRKLRRPRSIVIVPSRDLVSQVTASAKILAHQAKLRVVGLHSRTDPKVREAALLAAPIDLLVCTPGMLLNLMENQQLALSQTRYVVVDEADTLFDTNFKEEIMPIIKTLKGFSEQLARSCRFLFTTATLPKTLSDAILAEFPEMRRVYTPNLHRTQPKLHQSFLRLDSSTTKPNMLLEILRRAVLETDRIIVFCNRRQTCFAVSDYLKSKSYDVVTLSSMAEINHRATSLVQFLNPQLVKKPVAAKAASKSNAIYGDGVIDPLTPPTPPTQFIEIEGGTSEQRQIIGKPMIMVATDIGSRGLDTTQVGHVILYDFPQTAIDYLHRVGRTARNGGKGRSTAMITRRDATLAEFISNAVKKRDMLA
ncbi:hypothetical protein BASA61_006223 [Batrachochytrium salamandrivorans]|nr:hypothetical protein BASA62_010088 [Batrachochytrium salamandrivorans]KAH6587498.1 hypothetical protein BASA61_006223 [Batrachochytrium salamandrivorans]